MCYKGLSNKTCEYYPCHENVKREFNCLFCYCPLYRLKCPGMYKVITDNNGQKCKDCSNCTMPHNGYEGSWHFIQSWLKEPKVWEEK